MNLKHTARHLASASLTLSLVACGGGNGDASIGGSVSGLAAGATVTIQDNGSDTLTLTANSSFGFANTLAGGSTYAVTVLTQPSGQICTVQSGAGTIDTNADSISNITVTCVSVSSVGGTVAGLAAGTSVTLSNGTVLLPVALNGAFAFPGLLSAGSTYAVTVATQPVGETCTVLNGTGTVTSGVPVAVAITCS